MNASERRAQYLDDLSRALEPLTAVQRIQVVDDVRTRIDEAVSSLEHEASDAEMTGILAGIGSVAKVAQQAIDEHGGGRADRPEASATTSAQSSEASTTSGASQASSTSTMSAPAEPSQRPEPPRTSLPAPAAAAERTGTLPKRNFDLSSIPKLDWPEDAAPRPGMTKKWVPLIVLPVITLGAFFVMFLLPVIVLAIGIMLLWMSPLWERNEKLIGSIVPAIGLGAFLPLVSMGLGPEGNPPLAMLGLVLAMVGLACVVWLAIRANRRSRQFDEDFPATEKKNKKR